MRKILYNKPLMAALTAAICLVTVVAGTLLKKEPQRPQEPAPQIVQTTQAPFEYLLRAEDGALQLYYLGKDGWVALQEYTVMLGDLPARDREYLLKGIALKDGQELQRALEDYLPSS